MRIYEGSPRQDFEEVFRSMGAFIDEHGMRDILLVEAPDGFIVQGLVVSGVGGGAWSETIGSMTKETLTPAHVAGQYEMAFRVIGRYLDEQKPRDVFFFEQEGAFVVRVLMGGQAGNHHQLIEFTKEDVTELVARGPSLRHVETKAEA